MTQELSDFALGFVKGCANKNMTVDQMLKAAMHASDNIPGIKSELQPLLTMDKEAGKWNPKNVWGGAQKVWKGMKDIPGWFASKFNKNIDDVPTPTPPARDPTFSDPTPAPPPKDLTFNDVPEPPEHLQEMLRIPNPTPPPSPGVPNPVPPPEGNIFINRQTLNSPKPAVDPLNAEWDGQRWHFAEDARPRDELDDLLDQIDELGRPPGKQIDSEFDSIRLSDMSKNPRFANDFAGSAGQDDYRFVDPTNSPPFLYETRRAGLRPFEEHTPRNIFLPGFHGSATGKLPADATRAEQWDWMRGKGYLNREGTDALVDSHMGGRADLPGVAPHIGQNVPFPADMQDYFRGRENWYVDRMNRGYDQVEALKNKPANPQLTGMDALLAHIQGLTPRQLAMMKRLEIDYGQPLDALQKQWDAGVTSAAGSGRRIDPGDVDVEIGEHMFYRNAENRARQAGLQTDYDAVYEQLKITNPAEAEAFRKMQNMMKKLKEMGAGQPAPGDLLIPPPSSHPQVQVPPYRGKQGMANVKLALDMFRDGRSLNAQQ